MARKSQTYEGIEKPGVGRWDELDHDSLEEYRGFTVFRTDPEQTITPLVCPMDHNL
jgi:hypothetical protein